MRSRLSSPPEARTELPPLVDRVASAFTLLVGFFMVATLAKDFHVDDCLVFGVLIVCLFVWETPPKKEEEEEEEDLSEQEGEKREGPKTTHLLARDRIPKADASILRPTREPSDAPGAEGLETPGGNAPPIRAIGHHQ